MTTTSAAACLIALAAPAAAATFTVPVDPFTSSATVQICLGDTCDDDTSPINGTVEIELDSVTSPTTITLHDLDLAFTSALDFNISLGLFGGLTANAPAVTLEYSTPGFPTAPAPINAGAYKLTSVEILPDGPLTYNATGLVCVAIQAQGGNCNDTIFLSQAGPQTIDSLPGMITSVNRVVTVNVNIDFTAPVNPDSPDLGTYTVIATVRGSVFVPACPGDANDNGVTDFEDLEILLDHWGQAVTPGNGGDVNFDGSVDFADLEVLLDYWGEEC